MAGLFNLDPLLASLPPDDQTSSSYVSSEEEEAFRSSFLSPYQFDFNDNSTFLGSGSFGIVCSGIDKRTGKPIACKKVIDVFGDKSAARLTYREVAYMESFNHDNVLGLLGIEPFTIPVEDPQHLYIYMEYMEMNLKTHLDRNSDMDMEHIQIIVYQILRGLKYLHSGNIMHRDIKPQNMLINGKGLLKLCDFGLARAWTPNDIEELSLQVVTDIYKAPELLMLITRYTPSIDIWSVGCTVGELIKKSIMFKYRGLKLLHEIVDVVGKPTDEDMDDANWQIQREVTKWEDKQPDTKALLMNINTSLMTEDAADFLERMLAFNRKKRIDVNEALSHPFVARGRELFHSTICTCCPTVDGEREMAGELEPKHSNPFPDNWERDLAGCDMLELQEKVKSLKPVEPLTQEEAESLN